MLNDLLNDLNTLKNPEKAKILQGFFKTGKGDYGEGDIFLGINVPPLRTLAKKYTDLGENDLEYLLHSKIHDHRFLALNIIRHNYENTVNENKKEELFQFSLKNISSINNWDLVDGFIPYVFGEYFYSRKRDLLYTWVHSKDLWERRISIMTTFYFLKNKDFSDTIKICELLLQDTHDLIHKATGWMLREMGKREIQPLYDFLDTYSKIMPRTMLRYAIEKLDKEKREYYMKK